MLYVYCLNFARETPFLYNLPGSAGWCLVSRNNKKTVDKWPKVCIYLNKGGGLSSPLSFPFFQFKNKLGSVAILISAVFTTLNIIVKINWTRKCYKCWRHHIFFSKYKVEVTFKLYILTIKNIAMLLVQKLHSYHISFKEAFIDIN